MCFIFAEGLDNLEHLFYNRINQSFFIRFRMTGPSGGMRMNAFSSFKSFRIRRGMAFGAIIVGALLAFEVFNYSTTEFALRDLLGKLSFAGFEWATILSIAFCGIDFAGIARLFTPEQGNKEPSEVWYLFGAWLLAATMNAILTWWGVSIAIASHAMQSTSVIDPNMVTKVVPVFVAIMVWVIRILVIGTLSYTGDRIFSQADQPRSIQTARIPGSMRPTTAAVSMRPAVAVRPPSSIGSQRTSARQAYHAQSRSEPAPVSERPEPVYTRPEPTYHSLNAADAQPVSENKQHPKSLL